MARDRIIRGQEPNRRGQADGNSGQAGTRAWGAALRRAREAKGWTQAELAQAMGYDPSVISKLETGNVTANEQHARAADQALGLPELFTAWLDDLTNGTREFFGRSIKELEQHATVLNVWEPFFIPGLLQTEEYMRNVFLRGMPDVTDAQVQQWVANRLARQKLLERVDPPPPIQYIVIWEPALRVPIGGPEVMHDQLRVLVDISRQDRRVRVQILPMDRGANSGMAGSFVIAHFADGHPAGFLDDALYSLSSEKRTEVAQLVFRFSALAADALDTQASAEFIRRVADEWKS